MHVSLQILSPAAAQAYGVHENWSGSKGDILWRKRLKGNSSASLPPRLTFVRYTIGPSTKWTTDRKKMSFMELKNTHSVADFNS